MYLNDENIPPNSFAPLLEGTRLEIPPETKGIAHKSIEELVALLRYVDLKQDELEAHLGSRLFGGLVHLWKHAAAWLRDTASGPDREHADVVLFRHAKKYLEEISTMVCASGLPQVVGLTRALTRQELERYPVDPYAVDVLARGTQGGHAYAQQFFTDEEVHNMLNAVMPTSFDLTYDILLDLYARWGRNMFEIPRSLQDTFDLIDLDRALAKIPLPPYPAIWVRTPFSGIYMDFGDKVGPVEIDGLFVHDTGVGDDRGITFAAVSLPNGPGKRADIPRWALGHIELEILDHATPGAIMAALEETMDASGATEQQQGAMRQIVMLYLHMLYYLSTDCVTAFDLYEGELDRIIEILSRRESGRQGRRPTKRQLRTAKREYCRKVSSKIHLLAPALVKGILETETRLPHIRTPESAPKTASGERESVWVKGHSRTYRIGPRDNYTEEGRYIFPHRNPRQDGDIDLKKLLTSHEYSLE
jgi:hypothetical protein